MDEFVANYKKIDKEVRQRISREMIDVIGMDNMLYGVIHAMVCECIDKDIPNTERRKVIIDKIDILLNNWIGR